ncbi:hypothetical protein [Undibacterium sp. Ren11W]|uniref:hypothetical protein n=1 Tax=Undibacterium sp. Ren11W TaxID=3413045 RepID=UPI003BF1814C
MPVSTLDQQALFAGANYSRIPATMLNDQATSDDDFGTMLTKGIRGAAANAINGMVNGAYADGQLQNQGAISLQASGNNMNLLILAGIAYFLFKG